MCGKEKKKHWSKLVIYVQLVWRFTYKSVYGYEESSNYNYSVMEEQKQ